MISTNKKAAKIYFSFKFKVLISYIVVITIIVLTVGVTSYKTAKSSLLEGYKESNLQAVTQIRYSINMIIDNVIERINTIRINRTIANFMNKYNNLTIDQYWHKSMNDFQFLTEQNTVREILAKSSYVYTTDDSSILLLTRQGVSFASWGLCEYDFTNLLPVFEEFFSENSNKIFWISPHESFFNQTYLLGDNNSSVTAVKPIINGSEISGYILVSFSAKSFGKSYIGFVGRKGDNSLILFDGKNNIFSSEIKNVPQETINNILDHTRKLSQRQGSFIKNILDKDFLITYASVSNSNWKVLHIEPVNNIISSINNKYRSIMIVIFITCIFTLLLSTLFAEKFSQRIRQLRDTMAYTDENSILHYATVNSNDEITELARCYNHMIDRINIYMGKIIEEQKKKREAELDFLQAQINSHFLYNTLNSIKVLTRLNKIKEINILVTSLVKLLKSTARKNEMITIDEEVSNLISYTEIQKIRYMNNVEVILNYPPNVGQCLIPNLILQPIVENSIIHGLSGNGKGSIIYIQIDTDNNDLIITVTDDGAGFDCNENIKDLKCNKINGLGIQNVRERIKINYGDGYGIEIKSILGIGTEAKIRIKSIK